MRSLSAQEILDLEHGVALIVDGWLYDKAPIEIFAEGSHNNVPIITGYNDGVLSNFLWFSVTRGKLDHGSCRSDIDVLGDIARCCTLLILLPAPCSALPTIRGISYEI